MTTEIRVPVRVCAANRLTTKAGKLMITQDVVIERGADKAPLIRKRRYFDEKYVLTPGNYTANLNLFVYTEKNEKGYDEEKGGWAIGDLQPAK